MFVAKNRHLLGETGLDRADVVHPQPRGHRGGDDKWHPDKTGVLNPDRRAHAFIKMVLGAAAQNPQCTAVHSDGHDQLRQPNAQIADTTVQAQRSAL